MKPETRFYLILAIIAFGLLFLGWYLTGGKGTLLFIVGVICILLSTLIFILFFNDRWQSF